VIIIDASLASATVITGSYNFTWSAQHKNAENILVLGKNPPLAARHATGSATGRMPKRRLICPDSSSGHDHDRPFLLPFHRSQPVDLLRQLVVIARCWAASACRAGCARASCCPPTRKSSRW
jgi:hypothetical protein